jgi:hypothetical protein
VVDVWKELVKTGAGQKPSRNDKYPVRNFDAPKYSQKLHSIQSARRNRATLARVAARPAKAQTAGACPGDSRSRT